MKELRTHLLAGQVIPAHPLALTESRKLDERHQRALTRYYMAAGAGGIAVGVHSTQFAIREPRYGLYEPVLALAAETAEAELQRRARPFARVAGVIGRTPQAVAEATIAARLRYDAVLLSLGAWREDTDNAMLAHCRAVGEVLPLFGFYLQPGVGGRVLSYEFWRRFAELPAVVAIKIAPFNRYQTLDVIRAVADSGRDDIALYTGNDDAIITDLLSRTPAGSRQLRICGGLLGQWAVWTRRAVETLEAIQALPNDASIAPSWLTLSAALTDANSALFDVRHQFRGCIAGLHEVLRRQGLFTGRWCLNPSEDLSPGQMEEIERVYRDYPELNDDAFVAENLDRWLA